MKQPKVWALLEVTCAVIFWGASFVGTKIALRDIAPITVVWMRFGMGVVILGAAVLIRRQFTVPARQELFYFALLGFLGITFHQWLQSNALVTSQATTTAWIVATTPVFIALLSWLFLKEVLGPTRLVGIMVAALGVLLVVTKGDLSSLELGKFGEPGDILVLISAVNWAVFTVLSRRGLRLHSAALMMFYVMTFGWLFSSLLFFATPGLPFAPYDAAGSTYGAMGLADIARLTLAGWVGVGFLGIFCSGLAYIFWYDALKLVPASQVGVFLYVEPLVTVVVAALVLQENLVFAAALGGAVILLGIWLVNRLAKPESRAVATTVPSQGAEGG
jgi:drug/metabolite transporter (DMT)-like permease